MRVSLLNNSLNVCDQNCFNLEYFKRPQVLLTNPVILTKGICFKACSVSILLNIFQGPGEKFLQGPAQPV